MKLKQFIFGWEDFTHSLSLWKHLMLTPYDPITSDIFYFYSTMSWWHYYEVLNADPD